MLLLYLMHLECPFAIQGKDDKGLNESMTSKVSKAPQKPDFHSGSARCSEIMR